MHASERSLAIGLSTFSSGHSKLLHKLVQVREMKVAQFSQMSDRQTQQRRGRAAGAIGSVADRSAVEENRALAPETAQASP